MNLWTPFLLLQACTHFSVVCITCLEISIEQAILCITCLEISIEQVVCITCLEISIEQAILKNHIRIFEALRPANFDRVMCQSRNFVTLVWALFEFGHSCQRLASPVHMISKKLYSTNM